MPITTASLDIFLDAKKTFLKAKKYLQVSSSADGTVKVWKLPDAELMHNLIILPKSNDFTISKPLAKLHWSLDGSQIVVPCSNDVQIFGRNFTKPTKVISNQFNPEGVKEKNNGI